MLIYRPRFLESLFYLTFVVVCAMLTYLYFQVYNDVDKHILINSETPVSFVIVAMLYVAFPCIVIVELLILFKAIDAPPVIPRKLGLIICALAIMTVIIAHIALLAARPDIADLFA